MSFSNDWQKIWQIISEILHKKLSFENVYFFTQTDPPRTVQRSAFSSFQPFLFIEGFDSSALCRSRRELSNEYLLAKIGVDTAENEPLEIWGKYSTLFNRVLNPNNVPTRNRFRIKRKLCVSVFSSSKGISCNLHVSTNVTILTTTFRHIQNQDEIMA